MERKSQLARARKSAVDDVVFEGVLIPKDTRSARLANKGITNEEEMGKFLTAVFADTLKGKIILPKASAGVDGPSRILDGLEEKLRHGLPIGIQPMKSSKRTPGGKVKER